MPVLTHDYEPITALQLQELHDRLPAWEKLDDALTQTFECDDFNEALRFAQEIGLIADEYWHHPEISLHNFNQVTVTLTTHDLDGLSTLDVTMAELIDAL